MNEELLKPVDAARLLRVRVDALAKWRHQKRGPAYVKVGGRAVRYRPSDIQAYLAANTRGLEGGAL